MSNRQYDGVAVRTAREARQYDDLNQYYCPWVIPPDKKCANYSCLRRRKGSRKNVLGPEEEQYECYDPASGFSSQPRVWNPVYDAGTAPPSQPPASTCDAYDLSAKKCEDGRCHWSIPALILVGALVAYLAYRYIAQSRYHREHTRNAPSSRIFSGGGGAAAVAPSASVGVACRAPKAAVAPAYGGSQRAVAGGGCAWNGPRKYAARDVFAY